MSKRSKRVKALKRAKILRPMSQRQERVTASSLIQGQVAYRVQEAQQQLRAGDFGGCIDSCKALLAALPRRSEMRLEVLALLGSAHGMRKEFQQSYEVFGEALALDATMAEVWFNHGLASYFTSRLGEAVLDFERAVALTKDSTSEIARKFALQLAESRQELREVMQIYGTDITFERYLEMEKRFTKAMNLVKQEKWSEAELLFRELTETGGRVPPYWGNLGVCLMMQACYDEAEEALKQALAIDPNYAIARDNLKKLPEIRRSKVPVEHKLLNTPAEGIGEQYLTLYEKDEQGEVISSTTIWKQGEKQRPRYDLFLNPYQDTRFTTCPRCGIKTRPRKFSLIIDVDPGHATIVDKICRFCYSCGLLIVHQDQVEKQLVTQFIETKPEIIGNSYQIVGTLDREIWHKRKQDPLSFEELREYAHDFREVVTFQRVSVEE